MSDNDEKFHRIVQQAIHSIENVKCTIAEYQRALQGAIDQIQENLEMTIQVDGDHRND